MAVAVASSPCNPKTPPTEDRVNLKRIAESYSLPRVERLIPNQLYFVYPAADPHTWKVWSNTVHRWIRTYLPPTPGLRPVTGEEAIRILEAAQYNENPATFSRYPRVFLRSEDDAAVVFLDASTAVWQYPSWSWASDDGRFDWREKGRETLNYELKCRSSRKEIRPSDPRFSEIVFAARAWVAAQRDPYPHYFSGFYGKLNAVCQYTSAEDRGTWLYVSGGTTAASFYKESDRIRRQEEAKKRRDDPYPHYYMREGRPTELMVYTSSHDRGTVFDLYKYGQTSVMFVENERLIHLSRGTRVDYETANQFMQKWRAGKEAKSDPYPHWYRSNNGKGSLLIKYTSPGSRGEKLDLPYASWSTAVSREVELREATTSRWIRIATPEANNLQAASARARSSATILAAASVPFIPAQPVPQPALSSPC